jgi:hypothetical protein
MYRTTLPYYKMRKVHFSRELLADDWDYICFQVESYHLNCPGSVQSTKCLKKDKLIHQNATSR